MLKVIPHYNKKMSWQLVIAGVCVHLILIYSIFDVYYTSPVVHGIAPQRVSNLDSPAKRVFVISADGLRYDTFNNNPEKNPNIFILLFKIASHIPTESRPGHVALFAGITEDISAVAKGWKKNPVEFDSVFNRSAETWMWGSPDIVELFDNVPHVHSFSYSSQEEDFASEDASKLDSWVFDNFEKFIKKAENDTESSEKLRKDGVIFFLHLLGIDTNGHGHKPHSKQYIDNIRVVDEGVRRVQELADKFFGDQKSAWIFTGDHGMTDWGSHGAGSDEEVLTPFIAWGSGIRKGGARISLAQIDVTPLISSLIGKAVPVNSMGVLPVQAMQADPQFTFRAVLSNFLQLKAQVTALRNEKSNRFWFQQYPNFGDKAMDSLESEMVKLAKARRYSVAISLFSENAMQLKSAIMYYHRYDRAFLGSAVSALFISWISLVICYLYRYPEEMSLDKAFLTPKPYFWPIFVFFTFFCFYCKISLSQSIYVLLPVYIFALVENGTLYDSELVSKWTNIWRLNCLLLMPFPFFPPVGVSTFATLCIISPAILAFACYRFSTKPILSRLSPVFRQLAWILAATAGFILVVHFFERPPAVARWISWLSIPLALILPFFSSSHIVDRLIVFSGAFFVPYSLLSINYESLFTLLFMPIVAMFVRFEFAHLSDVDFLQLNLEKAANPKRQKVGLAELRRAVICVAFVFSSLFGTGNFASINSFNPSTLNRFISVFSPFTMALLLVLKLLIPVLMTSLAMSAIVRFDKDAIQRLCCVVLVITDFMSLCFFHQLRDEGSWLDIGMSISQYIVSMCISLALLVLLFVSSHMMTLKLSSPKNVYLFKSKRVPSPSP
ncbi:unnamed protein product [Caenorhabditis auriculariae]|uniref:GPI ethanolamine phosphate transferase 1 n=1 Tax=Caenorhabditis auriculariae TaxID=2777116 RepID=A0A8S1HQD7_9PELO|nr:unnamed protein product [Caenorhabditis auriculariae]